MFFLLKLTFWEDNNFFFKSKCFLFKKIFSLKQNKNTLIRKYNLGRRDTHFPTYFEVI